MSLRTAFVGFGEVGHAMAVGMRAADIDFVAYDAAAPGSAAAELTRRRAAEAGVRLVDDLAALTAGADLIVGAFPAAALPAVARELAPLMSPKQSFADMTAAHPAAKKAAAEALAAAGAAYADLAIVGPVRVLGHRVPIMLSGTIAEDHLAALIAAGMDIERVSDQPGDASATKLCRSVFTKGIEALLVETLLAARRLGVDERVLVSIQRTLDSQPFVEAAARYVTGNAIHAERRVHEIEDVIALLESLGVRPLATAGALRRMAHSAASGAKEHFGGVPPRSYEPVIDYYAPLEANADTKQTS